MQYEPKKTLDGLNSKVPWSDNPVWAGCDIGEGWVPLVWDLIDELNALECTYSVAQVKEKFGGLRFYHDPIEHADDCWGEQSYSECPLVQAIQKAEGLSENICEGCGERATQQKDVKMGRWRSICDNCQ